MHEPYLFAPFPDGRQVVTWSSRERTRDAARARLVARRRRRLRGVRRALGGGRGARPAAAERAARPRALARGGRARDPRRLGRRRAGRHPLGGGARAVRDPGADRHAGRPRGPGHRVRRLLPRPRPGGRGAGRVGLRARRDGRGHRRRCAPRPRRPGRGCASRRRWSGCWWRTAARRAWCSRAARRCAPARVLSNADPLRTAALAGRRGAATGWRQAGPGGEGDGAARRPAGLPRAGPGPSRGAARSTSASRWTTSTARGRGRPRRPARRRGRGSRPRARPPPTTRWRRPGATCCRMFCQCFPPDVDAEAAADTAIARFAEVCPELPDRIVDRLALGPARARGALRHHRRPHLPRRDAARPAARGPARPARVRRDRGPLPGRLGRPPRRRGDAAPRACWPRARCSRTCGRGR